MIRNTLNKLLPLALILFFNQTNFFAQDKKRGSYMIDLIDQAKKVVVFIGTTNEKVEVRLHATGFLINVQDVWHLVTAKHVVMELEEGKFTGKLIDDNMYVFFNRKDDKIGLRSISSIKKKHNVNWMFHENGDVDIAIIPYELDVEKDDVKRVPENLFLDTERLFELYGVFFLSYQPGIEPQGKISPIIRNGTISLINEDKTFYIDASAFPGNSGSPVFLMPSPIRFDKGNVAIESDELRGKFIGMIGEYLPYQEVAISTQTGRPRVIFEENTGLSRVWSVTFITEIVESSNFKKQLKTLVDK